MKRSKLSLCLFLCCAAIHAQSPQSTDPARSQIESFFHQQDQVRNVHQVSLSPDGRYLAWSAQSTQDGPSVVFLANADDTAHPRTIDLQGKSCSLDNPAFSPDSKELAFLSDCAAPAQKQLYVTEVSSPQTTPRQISHFDGFISGPRWSPDGSRIAVLYVEHSTRTPSPIAAESKAVGVIDDLATHEVQRVAITDLQTGKTIQATPPGLYIFEYDWAPSGQELAYTAAPPPGDDNWYIADLYTQPVNSLQPLELYHPEFQIALPRWSPDGASIAFITGLMSDEGATGGEIYLLPARGGTARNLTPNRPASPSWIHWISPSQLLFTEFTGGSTAIGTLSVIDAKTQTLWRGDESIHAGSEATSIAVASIQSTALIRTAFDKLPEVWSGPIGKWSQVTHLNEQVSLSLPHAESIAWSSKAKTGAFQVQGWLLYPANYDPAKRYPMLVAPHGGPAWITTPEWRTYDFNTTVFTNLGYFIFFPNVRGSFGQGERFTRANRRDWGFGDLDDSLRGIDEVLKRVSVDPKRIGILGWSYGGSTTMMAVTQTHRFRAAVAGAGAANWVSYYGQNSIDKWMLPYFGASIYDDQAAYARCSALTYIKQTQTPTLVLVGERDGEAPPAQSFEFWHALKELNVPTQLVVYPEEGHGFSQQADRVDVAWRTYTWFQKYMPDEGEKAK